MRLLGGTVGADSARVSFMGRGGWALEEDDARRSSLVSAVNIVRTVR